MSDRILALPVLPLRNLVLFPGVVLPVDIGRPGSLKLIEDVVGQSEKHELLVATQRDAKRDDPGLADLFDVVVRAEVLKVIKVGENRVTVVLRGAERARLLRLVSQHPYLIGEAQVMEDMTGTTVEADGLALALRETARQMITLSPEIPAEAAAILDQIKEPGRLADLAAANLELTTDERVALLGEADVSARLAKVLAALRHRVEVLKVKAKIDTQVREEMGKSQREHVLRQKLKAIQAELGEDGDGENKDEWDERIKAAGMPEDVEKVARKQLARMTSMPAASPEHQVTRTYLDWLVDVPWSKETPDKLDLDEARAVLDKDHYDLEKVKKRIIEYLAVRKLAPNKKGPILCLAGPPGVGKTSLGKSIARALGREFYRMSLGGVHDEAEIRGHRRTYIGALPGRIIHAMKKAGTRNPVIVLDEIDKLGNDFRGDPSAALLEVLDPEQNFSFSDHYLEVPFDLSKVLWIATANMLDTVPPALRDRLEIIELPGYTSREKRLIARNFLLPKQIGEHGLTEHHLTLTDAALEEIIDHYTREAGVRNLEREVGSVCRGVAVKVAGGTEYKTDLDAADIAEYLGPERFVAEVAERTEVAGVATGLAWTSVGGVILFVEATRMAGKGTLNLTGQLGDVMKESATAAASYVRSHAAELGIRPDFFERSDLHIHVPSGSTPKDGPSAGVTMLSAMVSLLTGRRVRHDTAMTGEISLRGAVLPVGGIKEKVLAAHRAGLTRVILPERNRRDLIDVPDEVKATLEVHFVTRMSEVIDLALEPGIDVPSAVTALGHVPPPTLM